MANICLLVEERNNHKLVSDYNTIRLWDVFSGNETLKLQGRTNCVSSVVFSPGGEFLASGKK